MNSSSTPRRLAALLATIAVRPIFSLALTLALLEIISPASAAPAEGLVSMPLRVPAAPASSKTFALLSQRETGLDLTHEFPATGSLEALQDQGAGAGICVGDFDGDGWPDLFVTCYDRGNRLFRNLGGLRFEDRTSAAGVAAIGSWCAGATAVDLDNDDDLDICVAVFNGPNLVFINRGDGTFTEEARRRGLAFSGASVMMAAADYDLDGNPDIYLVTHRLNVGSAHRLPRNSQETQSRAIVRVGPGGQASVAPHYRELFDVMDKGGNRMELFIAGQRDYLFRNLGNGKFTNAAETAGIQGNDIGLAAAWWDYNQDGWPDLYVANDYKGPDRLYRNQKDGRFKEVTQEVLPHVPWSSMGVDAADLNNDGRIDFVATEMAGSTHQRRMMILNDPREKWFLESANPRQYPRNAIYLATGAERVIEAAYLTGLARTDWTWSPKCADFDNDGWVDLFFANGMSRDFVNADLLEQMKGRGHRGWLATPVLKEANLAFRNRGNLQFENVSAEWGLDKISASFGAAAADLDRDGDLDLVVMNFGEPLAVYRNQSASGSRLLLRLKGTRANRWGLNALVRVVTEDGAQVRSLNLASGFLSANEPLLHFGLGNAEKIQELTVTWPGGSEQRFTNLFANRFFTITETTNSNRGTRAAAASSTPAIPWFRQMPDAPEIRHEEREFDDFDREPLLPWKLSRLGPGLAIGDVNGDGRDDLYLGGGTGFPGRIFQGAKDGTFQPQTSIQPSFLKHKEHEDMGALFFDADGDGDSDLFVVSGGVECPPGDGRFQDRLYLNDGKGNFEDAPPGTIPQETSSGSCVAAADFDRDGDLDLFVGGRSVPGRYPEPEKSRLLRNDGGVFRDATGSNAPDLETAGVVTSALWSDVDDDGWTDLLVAREWGPVALFRNRAGRLADETSQAGLAELSGWWNGIAGADVDGDGDIDYAVSNFGLNSPYQASLERPSLGIWGEFGGKRQFFEAYYEGPSLYPRRGLDVLGTVIPDLRERFPSWQSFAGATIEAVLGAADLTKARRAAVTTLESGLFLNDGQGRFQFRALPRLAQASVSFGIAFADWNGDGWEDLFIAQNFFGPAPETGRIDGGMSLLLRGQGNGSFTSLSPGQSGILIPGEARSAVVADIDGDANPDLLVGLNRDKAVAMVNQTPTPSSSRRWQVQLQGKRGNPTGIGARVRLIFENARGRTKEISAGGGYLSQSSAAALMAVGLEDRPSRVEVRWPTGKTSQIPVPTESLSGTAGVLLRISEEERKPNFEFVPSQRSLVP